MGKGKEDKNVDILIAIVYGFVFIVTPFTVLLKNFIQEYNL